MKSILIRTSFLSLCLLLCIPMKSNAASEQRTALVIGNSNYSSGPLKNPVNDATDMAAALRKAGFTVVLKKDANLETMEQAIEDFGNRLKRGGVGLFYYAGHGVQVNGVNYLVPIGAKVNKESDVRFKAIDVGRILAEMENANNGLNIVLLDACRDNPFGKSYRSASRGLSIVSNAPTGTFISYSTGAGQVARDGEGRNSPYTRTLLQYMREPGVPITELFIKVRQKLRKETGQVPWELSSLEGEFYFVPGAKKAAADYVGDEPQKEEKSTQIQKQESSAFADLKRKMEERREKESQWVKDFEDAKQMEADSPDMAQKIQVWRQFLATLPNELTAKGNEIQKRASNRAEMLEHWKTIGKTPPKEIRSDGRFIAYDDGTVLDTRNKLMWAAKDNEYDLNWVSAKSYCDNYRGGGYKDWRMPTEEELKGIFGSGEPRPGKCQQAQSMTLTELINLSCYWVWTSSTNIVPGGQAALYADFRYSPVSNSMYIGNYAQKETLWLRALPVRSIK